MYARNLVGSPMGDHVPVSIAPLVRDRGKLIAWKDVTPGQMADDGRKWYNAVRGIQVIESVAIAGDDRVWHHVSVSLDSRLLPDWETMGRIESLFIGDDKEAYMINPPADRFVNLAPVLHWWCCLDAPDGVLPRMEGENSDVLPGVLSI